MRVFRLPPILLLLATGFLNARAQDPLASVATGSTLRVTAPWYDYDGEHILGAIGPTVYLWDAHTGRILRTFGPHGEFIHLARFSPDGKYILTISYSQPGDFDIPHPDSATRLWELNTGKLLWRLDGDICAKFSTDGTRLLTISSPATGGPLATLREIPSGLKLGQGKGACRSLAISTDNSTFTAGDMFWTKDGRLIATPRPLFNFNMYGADGDMVMSGNQGFEIWSRLDGSKHVLPANDGGPHGDPAWTPNGAYVVGTTQFRMRQKGRCETRIWTVATGNSITPSPCPVPGGELMMRPHHEQVLAMTHEAGLDPRSDHSPATWALYDLSDGLVLWQSPLSPGLLGFAPDGNSLIAFAGNLRENLPDHIHCTIFSAETGKPQRTLTLQQP